MERMRGRNMSESSDYEYELNQTITVGELIEELSKYPLDMKVMSTWESTKNSLRKEDIYYSFLDCVFIDADSGYYKRDYEKKWERIK